MHPDSMPQQGGWKSAPKPKMKLWLVELAPKFKEYGEEFLALVRAESALAAKKLASEGSEFAPYSDSSRAAQWLDEGTIVKLLEVDGEPEVILTAAISD